MSISHVQGASAYGPTGNGGSVSLSGVTAGDCLVLSIGCNQLSSDAKGFPQITDNRGNAWQLATMSPVVTRAAGTQCFILYTFVALNCAGGDTNVTYTANYGGTVQPWLLIDEYSGVASASAIGPSSFNSTTFDTGSTSVDSLAITAVSGQMLYSAAMASPVVTGATYTFTASAGFTGRQAASNTFLSAASWDKLSSGGSEHNVASVASGTPDMMAVVLLALSPTVLTIPLVQVGCFANTSIITDTTTAVFPHPNTAGNLLVAIGMIIERLNPVITDTNGNEWVIVYDGSSPSNSLVVAYAINCAGGANSVTMNTLGGGDDNSLSLIIAEYEAVSGYLGASFGNGSSSTVDTGGVPVSAANSLLVSCFFGGPVSGAGDKQAFVPALNLGNLRFQLSDSGFVQLYPYSLALADQVESAPGTYDNVFDVSPMTGTLQAAILGFKLSLSLACASGVAYLGVMYNSAVVATGGKPPYTFSIISGGLPPGLSLNASTGAITGIPTALGIYPYTAQVQDSLENNATASCAISITQPLQITCGKMPTLELTRDLDADWDDESTFFITQSDPLPFTLRGIVLRLSYNQD